MLQLHLASLYTGCSLSLHYMLSLSASVKFILMHVTLCLSEEINAHTQNRTWANKYLRVMTCQIVNFKDLQTKITHCDDWAP